MSQNSVVLPTTGTVSGLQMTQAMNNALDTLYTLSSGASAPSAPAAGQLWHDTTNNIIKLRSADNTSWISLFAVNESAYQANASVPVSQAGFVNRLINSAFSIDQVNEGASYTIPTNNTYTYTADQWVTACLSSTAAGVTAQRITDAPSGFTHSLKLTVGTGAGAVAATDYLVLWQPVEAHNLSDLALGTAGAGTLSVSFWVKASIAGTYAVTLQNAAGTRSCVNKFTIASAGAWQFVTIAGIPCDQGGAWASGNAASLYVYFTLAVGSTYQTSTLNAWAGGAFYGSNTHTNSVLLTSGATFQVTGVMLNAGVFPLPYEKRSIQQELVSCLRYYEKTFPQGMAVAQNVGIGTGDMFILSVSTAAGTNYVWWPFTVRKRVAPTIVTYNPAAANANWRDVTASADKGVASLGATEWGGGVWVNATTTVGDNLRIHISANARM